MFVSIRRRCFAALALLITCSATIVPAWAQLLQRVVQGKIRMLPGAVTWGKTSFGDVTLTLHFRTRVRPTQLLIGRDHPNGTRFLALFPGVGVPLPLKFDNDFNGFDSYGELKKGYFVQAAEHDFDRDGIPAIAVGDGLTDLMVNVLRYRAPSSARQAARTENWSVAGSFRGQATARIEGDHLWLPIGSQGLFDAYRWRKGKLVKTN